ncbi:zona pellucida glycoprotein d [Gouania willdenowi]|uniref:Uromodulin-like n=1 Tax=Gouania willdenowi TaxID=441366 RepID=A0A8C5GWQ9_GOUWI|nr:uromodulin-like [Gouania willdenowi]
MNSIDWKLSFVLLFVLALSCSWVHGVCDVKHCTDITKCVLSRDNRRCKCVNGFYGESCDKNADIKVMCSKDFIAIRVLEDFFIYHNIALESLHLPNTSCRAQREVIGGVPYYMSKISKDKYVTCGGQPPQKNLTHISYSLSLQSNPQVSGNIIRDPVIKLDFKCLYPYIRSVSLPFPVTPLSSETVMHVDELDATIQMSLYTDNTYTKVHTTTPSIELRDKVYVEVSVAEPADYFLLQINECWATQSPQPNSTEGSTHTLLQNGCAKDQTVSFISVAEKLSGNNGESSTVHYSFDMFRFTAEPHDLYLHCIVQLCERDDQESCIPNCNSINKRAAERETPPQSLPSPQGLLSYGPIKIEIPDRPQSSLLVAVLVPVAVVWTLGFFLIILIAVAKAGSRRLAQREKY